MHRRPLSIATTAFACATLLLFSSCRTVPGTAAQRRGDEIIVAGQLFHTGTPVVTWMDAGGYDAYRVERRFSPYAESGYEQTIAAVKDITTPTRYSARTNTLSPTEIEKIRGGGWTLPQLQNVVDQFVLHYDVCGLSKTCFNVLHDHRGLSVHFMLDLDGTIYQTLDLKERARHATTSNNRSIGIEIANMGAYPPGVTKTLDEWYGRDDAGRTIITIPARVGDPMLRVQNFVGRPARPEPIRGIVQGTDLVQYDFTPEQYAALAKLTAALTNIFPKITCDIPRGPDGQVLPHKLPDAELAAYRGVLGHYHIQTNKTDPGPALQWEKLLSEARALRN
jgi:N-acetyl-anhydromuramyl-L-alanine amidase AmpD